jgi:hypothetical protein
MMGSVSSTTSTSSGGGVTGSAGSCIKDCLKADSAASSEMVLRPGVWTLRESRRLSRCFSASKTAYGSIVDSDISTLAIGEPSLNSALPCVPLDPDPECACAIGLSLRGVPSMFCRDRANSN